MRTGNVHPGLGRRRGHRCAGADVLGRSHPEDARASLRRPARGPRHRQQPPGCLLAGRGGGQRRPVRRGELAARIRPLSRRLGIGRVEVCARMPQADRHHVPHAVDRSRPAATAHHPEPGGPQPRHRRDDESRGEAVGESLPRVGGEGAGDSAWRAGGSLPARRHAQDAAGLRRPAGDLHVRTDQSRQGAGIHDSGHAPRLSPLVPRPSI